MTPHTPAAAATVIVVTVERRRRGVAAVTIDGDERPHVLPLESLVEHAVHEGARFSPELWEEIRGLGRRRLAIRRALGVVARRRRTESQVRRALVRDFDEGEIADAVARLRDLGYVDDESWARDYVASPRALRRGRRLLSEELARNGIDRPVADDALADHDEMDAAFDAARRRLGSLGRLDDVQRHRRLYGFLARRGFSADVAEHVVRSVLRDAEPAGPD